MKRNLLISFFILAFANNLSAQNPLVKQWDKDFGGTGDDWLFSFQQTTDGGYILGGRSLSGISGDKTQASWGGNDFWIVKLDSIGNKQWDKDFGGTQDDQLYSLFQTSDGGYIFGGVSASGISGNKTQANWDTTNKTPDYWVVKTDASGNIQWDKTFGGINTEVLNSIQQTSDGGFIFGGWSLSGISGDKTQASWGNSDYWIVKTDSVGTKQWDRDFGGLDIDKLCSIHQTKDKGYILGGYSASNISGNKTQDSWGYEDFWIVKIDSLGSMQWDRNFGGTLNDYLISLNLTTDGGYILGGYSASDSSGDKTHPTWGSMDYWILKTDSLGNKQWDKDFGGTFLEDEFGNINQTSDGGYLIAGNSYSNISGDKTQNNLGLEQSWVIKTDAFGIKLWDKTVFTTGHDEQGMAIETNDGCYAMVNITDAGIGSDKTQLNWGSGTFSYDYWIVKFCDTTSSVIPTINLSSSDTSFCEKNCIDFFDLSQNNPTSWQWFFPGADSTTSNLQNPTNICYSNYGSFDVTLIACNAAGCDTLVLHNFINEYQNPVDSIWGLNDTLFSLPAFSYQWYEITSGLITGATSQFYVPTQLGSYFCVVSDSIGCVVTSNTIVLTGSWMMEDGGWKFQIQPNPFTNLLTITLNNNLPSEITLYDITSRKLLQQTFTNSLTINTQQLASGIYFYEVRSTGVVIGKGKVVKD